jgi:methylisocitrate lyase
MALSSPGRRLREAVAQSAIVVPGVSSALVGKLAERQGFDALYVSGGALSASMLALPDVGLLTLTELAEQVGHICRSVEIPVIVDADTGFGDELHVGRTIHELERVGAAAIQLEDQEFPKRCGHLGGKSLVDVEVMCAKLRAADKARDDADLVLIARTDARGVTGMDDALERARRYLAAGADWIFPEALASREEFERFASEIQAPLVANMTEFGKSPLLSLTELADLGYAAVLFPVTLLRVAMKAMEAALGVLAEEGTQTELLDLMQTREELYDLLDYDPANPSSLNVPEDQP